MTFENRDLELDDTPPEPKLAEWLLELKVGQKVRWIDPDRGLSSGEYEVESIGSDSGAVEDGETIVCLTNEAGSSAEVWPHELEQVAL